MSTESGVCGRSAADHFLSRRVTTNSFCAFASAARTRRILMEFLSTLSKSNRWLTGTPMGRRRRVESTRPFSTLASTLLVKLATAAAAGAWRIRSLLAFFITASVGFADFASAATFTWDGRTYIPLGLQAQSQSVLRFPESLSGYVLEDPSAVRVLTIDDRTLSFSPAGSNVEARVILRGESGTLYLARASTTLRFYPLLEVLGDTAAEDGVHGQTPGAGSQAMTPVSMMVKLMQRRPPPGFQVARSLHSILETPDFRLDSEQVWPARYITDIVATSRRTARPGARA